MPLSPNFAHLKGAVTYLRLFGESVMFALQAIWLNKLRTFLSILGITVGIFSVILVLTIVDSLEKNLKDSINKLGSNVIYVQKWPWDFGSNYPWWKYLMRPEPSLSDLDRLRKYMRGNESIEELAFLLGSGNQTLKHLDNSIENATLLSVSSGYDRMVNFEIFDGRYFSDLEMETGIPVAVLGSEIAGKLFPGGNAIGKTFSVQGRKYEVIGILEKQGQSIISNSMDDKTLIPVNYLKKFRNIDRSSGDPMIMALVAEGIEMEAAENELRGAMRTLRKLKPTMEDNFALNKISIITQGIAQTFKVMNIAGWFIGGLSVLVGGFGIANIMFVSVKERTNVIGIQKSLGARKSFILFQFLSEAVTLCLIGGIIGLLLVFLAGYAASSALGFEVALGLKNILTGLGISVTIGLLSGVTPAKQAADLDPVEAIRTKI